MSCNTVVIKDICPTVDQTAGTLKSLLPRGMAWQSDGAARPLEKSRLLQFIRATAVAIWNFETLLCAWQKELFCSTSDKTIDLWACEYAHPDDCNIYPTVCDKVTAFYDGKCSTLSALALKLGYIITCYAGECDTRIPPAPFTEYPPFSLLPCNTPAPVRVDCCDPTPPAPIPCDASPVECIPPVNPLCRPRQPCEPRGNMRSPTIAPYTPGVMFIGVDARSPALGNCPPPRGGTARAGCTRAGGPSFEKLMCLLQKFVAAHLMIKIILIKPNPCEAA